MATTSPEASARRANGVPKWQRVLLIGVVLWVASILVTAFTGNLNLIPTVVLLGSFLVPVTAVVWYLDHYRSDTLTPQTVLYAFVIGGVLGVLGASILESWLLADGLLIYLGVGLIEEACKLAALIILAWNMPRFTTRDGIVLGAAVGFGFGALENAGYALNALIVPNGSTIVLSLPNLVSTEFLRGVLSPVGHGLWTAILGGVLFRASQGARHPRITGRVVLAYLGVSVLHSLWDAMRGIALILTALVTGASPQQIAVTGGLLAPPTSRQIDVYLVFQWGGLIIISLVGFLWLRSLWLSVPEHERPHAYIAPRAPTPLPA